MRIILLVENDAPLRGMYRTALRLAGFFVQEAANGFDALRALDSDPPDLVVLDLALLPLCPQESVGQVLPSRPALAPCSPRLFGGGHLPGDVASPERQL